ncbi:jg1394, partial [Pararge aegeria aegeria]
MDPKPSWEECVEAAKLTRQYVDICLQTLCQPAATLPPDRKAAKDDFEWKQPFHVLKPLREVAIRKVPISTPVSTPEQASSGRSVLVRWFPQWWGWYAEPPPTAPQPTTTTTPMSTPNSTTSGLEDEILDVIADSLDDNTMLRRDAVFGLFEFTLERGSLDLCTETEEHS